MQYNKIEEAKVILTKALLIKLERKLKTIDDYCLKHNCQLALNEAIIINESLFEILRSIDPEPIQLMTETHEMDINGNWISKSNIVVRDIEVYRCGVCEVNQLFDKDKDGGITCIVCGEHYPL